MFKLSELKNNVVPISVVNIKNYANHFLVHTCSVAESVYFLL